MQQLSSFCHPFSLDIFILLNFGNVVMMELYNCNDFNLKKNLTYNIRLLFAMATALH